MSNPFADLGIVLPIDYNKAGTEMRRMAREEYARRQNGKCYLCLAPLGGEPAARITATPINENLFPTGFFEHPVHLHHDHRTGLSIGAVHAYCNAYLWQIEGE